MNALKMLVTVGQRVTLSGLLAVAGLPPLLADTSEATIVVPSGPLTVTAHQPVAFEGRSTDSRQSEDYVVNVIRWQFGDGQSAAGGLATHVFGKPGVYRVAMTVRYTRKSCVRQNPDGTCSRYRITTGHARATRQVTVVAPPVASSLQASNLVPARGGTFTLTPSYSRGIGSLSQGLACPPSGFPTAPIQADWSGPRTFVLTVTNAAGMTAQASVSVTPQPVVVGAIQPANATKSVATSTSFG
ncbi:MAG TPA: PKD domain-containing protein, partial [Geothrix sp.]|nr:PKD domain-containing protein [Geothrix sp.]